MARSLALTHVAARDEESRFGPKKVLGWAGARSAGKARSSLPGFIALTLARVIMWQGTGAMIAVPVLIGLLLVIVVLTGDPPGGPGF